MTVNVFYGLSMKNILVFSDGTANDTGGLGDKPRPAITPDLELSNIYRLYVASNPVYQADINPREQVAFYDPGLGSKEDSATSTMAGLVSTGWYRTFYRGLSMITGLGITGNIEDCYTFIVEHYNPGDQIYLFGFSRGAYTVRSLGGLLALLGVIKNSADRSKQQRQKLIRQSVKIYKIRDASERNKQARLVDQNYHRVVPHAICVFDTVRALGLSGGITGIADSLGEKFAPHKFHNHQLDKNVPYAFHAVSVDENRKHFSVELWDSEPKNHRALKQKWFPGVHSDVGGSYPDGDSGTGRDLGRMTLDWMLSMLEQHDTGFQFNREALDLKTDASRYHLGDIHNQRAVKRFFGLIPTGKSWPEGFRNKASDAPLEPDSHDPDLVGQIDKRVVERINALPDYRPVSLKNHPEIAADLT